MTRDCVGASGVKSADGARATAMAAGLRRSSLHWLLLLGDVVLFSILEATIGSLFIGMRGHLMKAAPASNIAFAATVFANFYWLQLGGLRLVRSNECSDAPAMYSTDGEGC